MLLLITDITQTVKKETIALAFCKQEWHYVYMSVKVENNIIIFYILYFESTFCFSLKHFPTWLTPVKP